MVKFQSTYLYKVRLGFREINFGIGFTFQSTYLYKVRLKTTEHDKITQSFNPRTYIRYDKPTRGAMPC